MKPGFKKGLKRSSKNDERCMRGFFYLVFDIIKYTNNNTKQS